MKSRTPSVELLESRIAPAQFLVVHTNATTFSTVPSSITANAAQTLDTLEIGDGGFVVLGAVVAPLFQISTDGKTATYTETDGDVVSVVVSKGRLRSENFIRTADAVTGRVDVDLLDLTAIGLGARFQGADITVNVTAGGGDGFGDLAGINARGIDLGRVIVTNGDLGQIDVGDADLATPALRLLQPLEMGFYGSAGQIAGQDTVSKIRGSVLSVKVSELRSAFIDVRGAIGTLDIGLISATGETTDFNGSVRATGPIGSVKIGSTTPGGITGGAGDYSGVVWSRARIGSVTVIGDVTGGDGFDSGAIFAGSPDSLTAPLAGRVGPTTIRGSIVGGAGEFSGTLYADSGLLNVEVLGSVTGGTGNSSGALIAGLGFANITIVGDLASGTGLSSGSIVSFAGSAPNITILGRIVANNFADSGIFINGTIGTLNFQSAPGGVGNATEIRARDGMGTMNVFGDMNDVFVRAGTNIDGQDVNANVVIRSVVIGGNFAGGGLMAGAAAGADGFTFSADDILITPDSRPGFFSRIDSVIVKGTFTPFAVEAERIGSIIVAGTAQNLAPGARNDNFLLGTTVIKETL